ncbi:steroid delta-isomerase [Rheinheimera sediminis]|uniref:nuclear transport factor 2 family protein n=1 Tax=Rheinheimera sp. YQF-1 TaxID=2499626 RepID=UPI000FD6EF96|nr:nuclear transport factor 2 family protein [Rheinheimera sp. YQF-1]RVT45246.1 steroid delta-isomerase [Rheinheimera sp. YQF-1]
MTNSKKQITPEQLIQQQLDAYNSKDTSAWLACYHPDAVQLDFHGLVLARGHGEMQQRISQRFAEADLHAQLLNRIVMGEWVIDHELIQRNFPEGRGQIELLCSYQVKQGLIVKALFQFGEKVLL